MAKTPEKRWEPEVADFDRAFKAIGRFLFYYSSVESALNDLIAKGLKLDGLNDMVVTTNLQFRDKIHVASTIVNLQGRSQDWKDTALGWIDKAREVSVDRNLVAHTQFAPNEDGIRFFVYRAKGKIEIRLDVWRTSDINAKLEKMDRVEKGLQKATEDISAPAVSSIGGLYALGASYADLAPRLGTPGLRDALLERLQAQGGQGSSKPTGEASGRRIGEPQATEDWAADLAPLPPVPPQAPRKKKEPAKRKAKRKPPK